MAVAPTIEAAPNVVILEASHARRGFAISWIAQTLVTAALIGICLHAEVVAYVARYASQQEISKLITIVSPVMAKQTPLPKDDEAVRREAVVDARRRGGPVQPGGRQRDGGTAAVSAAGARQGRSAGNRIGEGATGRRTETCGCGREARSASKRVTRLRLSSSLAAAEAITHVSEREQAWASRPS